MFLALKAEEEEGNQSGVKVEVERKRRGVGRRVFSFWTPRWVINRNRGGVPLFLSLSSQNLRVNPPPSSFFLSRDEGKRRVRKGLSSIAIAYCVAAVLPLSKKTTPTK